MANTVVKWQIITKDPEQAARFYTSVFGWTSDASNKLGYREIRTGGGIDGGIWPSPEGRGMVQLFVEVDDLHKTIEAASRYGAKVIVPKSALPDGDTMAILMDPAGISFGLVAAK